MQYQARGKRGEDLAYTFLLQEGYKILARNFRFHQLGEIDIVAQEGQQIVFVEVKSQVANSSIAMTERISKTKLNTLRKLAQVWLEENNKLQGDWRVDLVGIIFDEGDHRVEHYKYI